MHGHGESGEYLPLEQEEPSPGARSAGVLVVQGQYQLVRPGDRSGTLCVAARELDRPLGWLPGWHLSLVLQYAERDPLEYEGGPTRNILGSFGPIVVRKGLFLPRPGRRSVFERYVFRSDLWDWEQILDAEMERLNAAAVPYQPLGPNSNTVVRTLLLRLWLPPLQPVALAPGFNHEAL